MRVLNCVVICNSFYLFLFISLSILGCSKVDLPLDSVEVEKPIPKNAFSVLTSIGVEFDSLSPIHVVKSDPNRSLARIKNISIDAITESVTDCTGGGVKVAVVDDQTPDGYSQGDIFTTRFEDCVEGGSTVNGQREHVVEILTGEQNVDPNWSITTIKTQNVQQTNNISSGVTSVNGGTSIAVDVQDAVNFNQKVLGGWTLTHPSDTSSFREVVEFDVAFSWQTVPNGSYTWDFTVSTITTNPNFPQTSSKTLETLSGPNELPPTEGKIQISRTLSGISQLTFITALGGDNVLIEMDKDADGIIDSSFDSTWELVTLDPILYQFF